MSMIWDIPSSLEPVLVHYFVYTAVMLKLEASSVPTVRMDVLHFLMREKETAPF